MPIIAAMELKEVLKAFAFKLLPFATSLIMIFGMFVVIYFILTAIYRLYFTPSAKFPGPKLAAVTFWYEFYYDAWYEGQYTWKIRELHDQYGPFVRINPYEVHCNDPEFFDILYVSSAKRRSDKWIWQVRQSWTRNSAFKTIEHDLHRQRRNQLSPFFSKASIRNLESLIVSKVDRLCINLEESETYNGAVTLTHAFVALTLDIISQVCFGYTYGFLDLPDFERKWYEGIVHESRSGHFIRQFPWAFSLLGRFPWLASKKKRASFASAKKRQNELVQQVTAVVERHESSDSDEILKDAPPTIFDAMIDADVPTSEKSILRLTEEAQVLTAAGSLTTTRALESTFYYLLTNLPCLDRLRQELNMAIPDSTYLPSVAELEKLPYLTAVIHEGLRLSKGVSHRFARVSPDTSYRYEKLDLEIPRGIPVCMSFIDILEHPGIFPDPDIFNPERWLPFDSPEVQQRRKYLVVFGGGTRNCLGMNLAWAELYLTVAAVAQRFGGRLKLHNVVFERDLKIVVDGFNALPSRESKGLRVVVLPSNED